MNARSLKSSNRKNHKINQLNSVVSLSECEVCAITEMLNDDISDCQLLPDEFTIYRKDRSTTIPGKRGGGVLLVINHFTSRPKCMPGSRNPGVIIVNPTEIPVMYGYVT